ncbi:MAG: hypothetical protein AAB362_00125 [Patescibacteria group bacterium]
MLNDITYKVGGVVPENGFYACVPCGNKKYLKAGMRFSSCLMCFGKERKLFRKGIELWVRVFEIKSKKTVIHRLDAKKNLKHL